MRGFVRPSFSCWKLSPESANEVHFAVVDLDHVHGRDALAAFLPRWACLGERDLAVQARELCLPKCLPDCFRLSLPGFRDRGGYGLNAVIPAETFGQARERITALLPFVDERLCSLGIRCGVREPRREEEQVVAAVRS